MSIGVSCPQTNDNITVHVSGGQHAICVCGTYSSKLDFLQRLAACIRALFRWLLRPFRGGPARLATTTAQTIRVRVLAGNIATASSSPQPGDCNISPPTSPWCCRSMQLPSGSGTGANYTAFAWLLNSGGSIADGPHRVPFTAGGSGSSIDCCASCGSGWASPLLAHELAAHPRLEVAVPDGPDAGLHTARAVSPLAWELTVGGATYRLSCDTPAGLLIRGPSSSAPATSVEGNPFSAAFPGAVFRAAGAVVVTKA
jgi:hypothetical protein